MKVFLSLFVLASIGCNMMAAVPDADKDVIKERLKAHVQYLASDELKGRKAGSKGSMKAADYICSEWDRIGLAPVDTSYRLKFSRLGGDYVNLLAKIEGNDVNLKDEIIVIGAHYDHLGVRKNGEIYHGADDNASGTAAVIEVARLLFEQKDNLARTVYIAAFDGEELGLLGSTWMAEDLENKKVVLMLSIDMVGWYKASGELKLNGTGTINGGDEKLSALASRNGINVHLKKFESSVMTATDTHGFAKNGVATLAVTTGLKSPYHKPADTADKIDYDGLASISCYLADLVGEVAESPEYEPSGKVAAIHRYRKAGIGITAGIGSSHLDLGKNSAFVGQARTSYSLALECYVNLGYRFSLNAGIGVESANFWFPSSEGSLVGYERRGVRQIEVPVDIRWNIMDMDIQTLFVSVGGYYNYAFAGRNGKKYVSVQEAGLNRHGCGLEFGIGTSVGPLTIGYKYKLPLMRLFPGSIMGLPSGTKLPGNYFFIGWRF